MIVKITTRTGTFLIKFKCTVFKNELDNYIILLYINNETKLLYSTSVINLNLSQKILTYYQNV